MIPPLRPRFLTNTAAYSGVGSFAPGAFTIIATKTVSLSGGGTINSTLPTSGVGGTVIVGDYLFVLYNNTGNVSTGTVTLAGTSGSVPLQGSRQVVGDGAGVLGVHGIQTAGTDVSNGGISFGNADTSGCALIVIVRGPTTSNFKNSNSASSGTTLTINAYTPTASGTAIIFTSDRDTTSATHTSPGFTSVFDAQNRFYWQTVLFNTTFAGAANVVVSGFATGNQQGGILLESNP